MNTTPTKTGKISKADLKIGLITLFVDICLIVCAQLILKTAMTQIGKFNIEGDIINYILHLFHPLVIIGLMLYGLGTVLWIITISKLDLSYAYPLATVQYFLIFLGSWYFFGEHVPYLRFAGLLVITLGVIIISLDKKMI